MKKSRRLHLIAGMLAIGLAVVFIVTASTQDTSRKANLNVAQISAPFPFPCQGPDLAVTPPNIKLQSYGGQMFAVVTAEVVSKGTKDFVSGPGQAVGMLIFKKLWIPGDQYVLNRVPITRLNKGMHVNVGGSIQLSQFQKAGCDTPLKPNECCREIQVIVMVSYDPDIRKDGNLDNDDCNASNNAWPDVPATHVKYTIPCIKVKSLK